MPIFKGHIVRLLKNWYNRIPLGHSKRPSELKNSYGLCEDKVMSFKRNSRSPKNVDITRDLSDNTISDYPMLI